MKGKRNKGNSEKQNRKSGEILGTEDQKRLRDRIIKHQEKRYRKQKVGIIKSKEKLNIVSNNKKERSMNCKESKVKISSIVWRDLPMEEEAALASHLEGCASCTDFYHNYSKAVQGIMNERRIKADPQLYKAIDMRRHYTVPFQRKTSETPFFIMRPVIKLAYSLVAGVAAVLIGIWAGQLFITNTLTPVEMESYKQEISMQSSDLSGLNANMLNYVNFENPEEK